MEKVDPNSTGSEREEVTCAENSPCPGKFPFCVSIHNQMRLVNFKLMTFIFLKKKTDNSRCTTTTTTQVSSFKSLSYLDRFLAVWIFLSMALGIILGYFVPGLPHALQKGEFIGVSIPIAIGLLVMMYPILCKVQYEMLPEILKVKSLWLHFALSLVINWIVAPLFMVSAYCTYPRYLLLALIFEA